MTDHANAAAELLERIAARLRAGVTPEDIGRELILIARIIARQT